MLILGLTFSHIVSMAIYASDRADVLMMSSDLQMTHRVAEISRLLREAPTEWRERLVHIINSSSLEVSLRSRRDFPKDAKENWRSSLIQGFLFHQISLRPSDVTVQWREISPPGQERPTVWMRSHMAHMLMGNLPERLLRASIRLDEAEWINFSTAFPEAEPFWSSEAIISTWLMTIAIALLSLWVVRRMTRPLSALATASERLGRDVNARPLEATGPIEVEQVIRAFNQMQKSLRRFIDNRTRMLAAIAHDRKTPITLLRLRAEDIEDADEREKTWRRSPKWRK